MIRWVITALLLASSVSAQTTQVKIVDTRFGDPTGRYDHGILGDAIEYGALVLALDTCAMCARMEITEHIIRLPDNRVFEDIAPRLIDLDGDEYPEVIVVETDLALGAQLAVYDHEGKIAATPFLGQPHRWLAPIGAADFNGDGLMDIAYIEKPHLTKLLKIWTFENGGLRQIAEASGLTNHLIGDWYITGGVRNCGGVPEIITLSADWNYVVATRMNGDEISFETLGEFQGPSSVSAAMFCP